MSLTPMRNVLLTYYQVTRISARGETYGTGQQRRRQEKA